MTARNVEVGDGTSAVRCSGPGPGGSPNLQPRWHGRQGRAAAWGLDVRVRGSHWHGAWPASHKSEWHCNIAFAGLRVGVQATSESESDGDIDRDLGTAYAQPWPAAVHGHMMKVRVRPSRCPHRLEVGPREQRRHGPAPVSDPGRSVTVESESLAGPGHIPSPRGPPAARPATDRLGVARIT